MHQESLPLQRAGASIFATQAARLGVERLCADRRRHRSVLGLWRYGRTRAHRGCAKRGSSGDAVDLRSGLCPHPLGRSVRIFAGQPRGTSHEWQPHRAQHRPLPPVGALSAARGPGVGGHFHATHLGSRHSPDVASPLVGALRALWLVGMASVGLVLRWRSPDRDGTGAGETLRRGPLDAAPPQSRRQRRSSRRRRCCSERAPGIRSG